MPLFWNSLINCVTFSTPSSTDITTFCLVTDYFIDPIAIYNIFYVDSLLLLFIASETAFTASLTNLFLIYGFFKAYAILSCWFLPLIFSYFFFFISISSSSLSSKPPTNPYDFNCFFNAAFITFTLYYSS